MVEFICIGGIMPTYATSGSACCDLYSNEDIIIPPGGRCVIGTGLKTLFEDDYYGMVLSRSGLAAKHGVHVLNAPGIIDSDYKDELKVILHNSDLFTPFKVERGDKIAQFTCAPTQVIDVEILPIVRKGGLGSTDAV